MLRLIVALALMLCATSVYASDLDTARGLERQARDAFSHQHFGKAARLFARADRLVPRGATAFNAAVALQKHGDLVAAAETYATALTRKDLPSDLRQLSQERLSVLKAQLTELVIDHPDAISVSIGSIADRPVSEKIVLEPGRYTATITMRDGRHVERKLQARAGTTMVLDLSPAPPVPVAPTEKATTDPTLVAGFIALGMATVGAGLAIGLGVATLDEIESFREGGSIAPEGRARAIRLRDAANVSWLITGLAGLTSASLLIVSLATQDESVSVSAGLVRATLTVRW